MARIVSRHAKMARFLSSRGYSPTLVLQGDENAEHYKNKLANSIAKVSARLLAEQDLLPDFSEYPEHRQTV